MRRYITRYSYSLLVLLYACANPMSPTGGPKDETPPELIRSNPANGALNFKGNTVNMLFDEPIQVLSLKNELLVTPTYTGEFDSKSKKYEVTVTFDKPFDDSTTYTLNFREAISDITELNPAENLIIAFSTWEFLDSLSIEGRVKNLLTDSPVDQYTVGIYVESDTLNPFNGPPLYFTKTDETGVFSINNIKAGQYYLYAFNDKNDNLQIDSKNEKYGFLPDFLQLDSTITDIEIGVLGLDLEELSIASQRQNGQYYELKTSKYITDYQLLTPYSDSALYHKYTDDHRGIVLYNTFLIPDSLEIRVNLQDSLYNTTSDTVFISYSETSRKKDDFLFSISSAVIHKDRRTFASTVEFNKPVYSLNFDSLFIEWDTIRSTRFDNSQIAFEDKGLTLKINSEITQADLDSMAKNNEKPLLYLKPGAAISIESDTSKNKSLSVRFLETAQLGIIRGSINLDSVSYFIQLLDEKNEVVRTLYNLREYVFEDVVPATYRLRLLIDENNDGIWHPGNILNGQPPEPVYFYTSPEGSQDLILRANWELIDIDVNSLLTTVDKEELVEE